MAHSLNVQLLEVRFSARPRSHPPLGRTLLYLRPPHLPGAESHSHSPALPHPCMQGLQANTSVAAMADGLQEFLDLLRQVRPFSGLLEGSMFP